MGERIDALHIFTNNSGDYNKLHDGEPIGESIISDLRQYFILLFKNDYRYDYYNWQKIEKNNDPPAECYYNIGYDNDFSKIRNKIIKYIKEKNFDDNIEIPDKVLNSIANVNFIRDQSYIKGKYPYIKIENKGEVIYYIPDIITNENYKEKAIIASDLNKLNNMFKSFNYKDIDEFVILDFYKEFKNKIEILKNKIITDDDDIKKSIREDIIDKLKIIYKIDKKKSNKKNDRLDNEIEKIITERASRLADLNLMKNYNGMVGGGKTLSIDYLDTSLSNIFKEIKDIKNTDIQLNEIDKDILYSIKNIINSEEDIDDIVNINKIDIEKKVKIEGTVNINTECEANLNNITKIIKDNSIKKYKKYLALINIFDSSKNKTQSGGASMPFSQKPLLEKQNIQVPKSVQYPSNSSTNQVTDYQVLNNPTNQNSNTNNNQELILIDNILPEIKEIYINLINIYTFISKGNEEYGKALINEILREPEEEFVINLKKIKEESEAEKTKIKKSITDEYDRDNSEFADRKTKKSNSTDIVYSSDPRLTVEINSKINNLNKFKKNLEEKKKELIKELKRLYAILIKLKNIPYATEYHEHILIIINRYKLNFVDTTNVDNCIILRELNEYINKVDILLQRAEENKELTNKTASIYNSKIDMSKLDKNTIDIKYNIQKELTEGKELKELYNLIDISDNNDLYTIIDLLKNASTSENINESSAANTKKNKNVEDEELIYETLWNEYIKGISNNSNVVNPAARYFTYLENGERLKNSIILNDLDPEIVLKVNIQDKAIFILLIFIIRTISIAIIELLIEHNIIKTLQHSVMVYALLYISMLLLFIIFINLDAYKLRIIFNYLNTHANISNVIIHLILFSIFAFLVIIIIQSDNFINNASDILDYTYIYNYMFDLSYNKVFKGEFENNISPDEKIKLLYRINIVSMLIFIFNAVLTLLII